MVRRAPAILALASVACVDGVKKPVAEPVFYARNVKAYAETATDRNPPETVLAWNVDVSGDDARFRECTSSAVCTRVERTRRKADLLAVERVGEAEVDGERVDVMKLSFTPRATYVVPSFKPAR